MNCFEFRRYCLSDPATQTAEFLSHKRDCPHCTEFAASVSLMDKGLADALRVEVPGNLASRIILRQSIMRDQTRQKRKWLLALAASVLIALGLVSPFHTIFVSVRNLVHVLRHNIERA